jgi:hypothetical protein
MASYSGRFISNLENDKYNKSCKLDKKYITKEDLKNYSTYDNCYVSINDNIYDITEYKKKLVENGKYGSNSDNILLDLNCGQEYKSIKEKNLFIPKNNTSSYNYNSYINKISDRIKGRIYNNEKEYLNKLNINELQNILRNRKIKYYDNEINLEKSTENEKKLYKQTLINRILRDNKIKENTKIYLLIAKIFIFITLLSIYYYTKNSISLYILGLYILYENYYLIKYILFSNINDNKCDKEYNINYKEFKIGEIKKNYVNMILYYILLGILLVFIFKFYMDTGNSFVIIIFIIIILLNLIQFYKNYKIKNEVVNDIKQIIY